MMDEEFMPGRYDEDGWFYNCEYDENGELVWLPEVIEWAKKYGFTRVLKGE